MDELEKLRIELQRQRKKYAQLNIAFNNVDEERCFLRDRAKRILALVKQIEAEAVMYEGQYNIYAPVVAPHERKATFISDSGPVVDFPGDIDVAGVVLNG